MSFLIDWILDKAERLTWEDVRIIAGCAAFVFGGFALVRLFAWALVALGLI